MAPKRKPDVAGTLYKITLRFCGVVALLSLAATIGLTVMYMKMKYTRTPHESSMRELRNALSVALKRPELQQSSAQQLADNIENLPSEIDLALQDFNKWTDKYQALFFKPMRSSSGSWKLHGKSLYYFSKGEKTWYDAENFCISRDAHLASVLNDEEQNFITSQIEEASWIGLTDEKKKGIWRWTDGSRLQKQYWSLGKPSHAQHVGKPNNTQHVGESNSNCTLIVPSSTNHNWNGVNCHKLYRWVCKDYLDHGKP